MSAVLTGAETQACGGSPTGTRRLSEPNGAAFAERDLLDRVLTGLHDLDIEGETARRIQRLTDVRARLAQVLGWLTALPGTQATGRVIERTAGWLYSEPRDAGSPSDGYLATLENVLHFATGHLNRTAVAVAYVVLPASVSPWQMFTALEHAAERTCAHVARRFHDVPGLTAGDRVGFREAEQLINAGQAQVLVTPSIAHLAPDRVPDAWGYQTPEGIRAWLNARGVRLVLADDAQVPGSMPRRLPA
ncbi:predicted protein [Streptomyces sp. C]|nr:predicted protein [Streptomyces sp. C]